jgi:hypothetical protein
MRHHNALLRLFAFIALLTATLAVILLRYTYRDYPAIFLAQKGTLTAFESGQIATTRLTQTHGVILRSSRGLIVSGRVRFPVEQTRRLPAVLVASGIETGHLVVELLDERPAVIVMAIRYPSHREPDFSGWNSVQTLLDLRKTGMKTVPSLLLALDYLYQHPRVDTNDIAVATVSFGTFVGVPAAALHPAVRRLIVVQGGGDIASIIAANAERLQMPLPARISGWIGGLFLSPFEPNRYIGDFSPRPLLMVNSPGDLLFPDESARSLYEHAGEPKEIVWHKSTHVMPGAEEIIGELTKIVVEKVYADYLPRE